MTYYRTFRTPFYYNINIPIIIITINYPVWPRRHIINNNIVIIQIEELWVVYEECCFAGND